MFKLLIVDDSNIIRNRIERSLAQSDIEIVGTACNGEEALTLFNQHQPNLITMDLTMPKMDGLECIQKIISQGTDVSILVVSALSDRLTALQALEYGARGFISKPFNEDELDAALQKLIKNRLRLKSR